MNITVEFVPMPEEKYNSLIKDIAEYTLKKIQEETQVKGELDE